MGQPSDGKNITEHVLFTERKYVSAKYFATPYEQSGVMTGYQMPLAVFRRALGGARDDAGTLATLHEPAKNKRSSLNSAGSARPRSELWSKGGASSASMKGLSTLPHQDASKSGELRNALVASEHELSETDTCLPPQPVQPSKRPGCCMIS